MLNKLAYWANTRLGRLAAILVGGAAVAWHVAIPWCERRRRSKEHPMKIVQIDMWHVKVPLKAPFYPSWIPGYSQEENRFDLIRLTTASGIEGWSAAPAMGTERKGWGNFLGSYLLGERADDLRNIRQRVREMGYLGHRAGWLEAACWDAVGKARNKPVYELLGGTPGKIRLYASTGQVRTGEEAAAVVKSRVKEGFDAVKIRVHDETLQQDIDQIRICRELVGPDVVLGVDANQGWRVAAISDAPLWDFKGALDFCKAAEANGYAWVEEPLAHDDYKSLAKLSAAVKVPITGGEFNYHGIPEFGVMAEMHCLSSYQPDAVIVGGISEVYTIAQKVAKHGSQYSPHTWTNGIGFAINLHLFASTKDREKKRLEYPIDLPGWEVERRDGLLVKPWLHERGFLTLPTAPGLGFAIDKWQLRKYGTHFYHGTPFLVAVRTIWERGLGGAKRLGAVRGQRLATRNFELQSLEANGGDPMITPLQQLVKETLQN